MQGTEQQTGRREYRWTAKEIIAGHTLPFLLLTAVLTVFLSRGADAALTAYLNRGRNGIFVYNYSLGVFSLALPVPAAVLSASILKTALNAMLAHKEPGEAAAAWERHRVYAQRVTGLLLGRGKSLCRV